MPAYPRNGLRDSRLPIDTLRMLNGARDPHMKVLGAAFVTLFKMGFAPWTSVNERCWERASDHGRFSVPADAPRDGAIAAVRTFGAALPPQRCAEGDCR